MRVKQSKKKQNIMPKLSLISLIIGLIRTLVENVEEYLRSTYEHRKVHYGVTFGRQKTFGNYLFICKLWE